MCDLGSLGANRSETVKVSVNPLTKLMALAPWFVIAAIILVRSHRRVAWLTFIPLFFYQGLAGPLVSLIPSLGNSAGLFVTMIMLAANTMAAWWMLAGKPRENFFVWFLRAFMAYVFIGLAQTYAYFGGFERETPIIIIYAGMGLGAVVIAAFITGLQVRKRFSVPRAMAWVGIEMIVACFVVVGTILGIVIGFSAGARSSMLRQLPVIAGFTLGMGVVLNLITQPFLVLALVSPFWRERMRSVFRVPEAQTASPAEPAPEPEPELQESERS